MVTNKVTLHRSRLVAERVTVYRQVNTKPSQYTGQLSLAVHSWVGALSTNAKTGA